MLKVERESFEGNLDDLKAFFPLQWKETIYPDGKEQLNPNLEAYIEVEKNDSLIFLSLRSEEKLIGYFLGVKYQYPHSKDEYYILQDSIFIHPDYRGIGGGVKLIKKAEEVAKELRVSRILLCSRSHNDITKLFERLNYSLSEVYYSKYIGN
jgi:GNAT superfamily N-acetyltransferase